MEAETGKVLSNLLGKRELDKIPPDIIKKLETYYDKLHSQLLTKQVVYETNQNNIGKCYVDFNKMCG